MGNINSPVGIDHSLSNERVDLKNFSQTSAKRKRIYYDKKTGKLGIDDFTETSKIDKNKIYRLIDVAQKISDLLEKQPDIFKKNPIFKQNIRNFEVKLIEHNVKVNKSWIYRILSCFFKAYSTVKTHQQYLTGIPLQNSRALERLVLEDVTLRENQANVSIYENMTYEKLEEKDLLPVRTVTIGDRNILLSKPVLGIDFPANQAGQDRKEVFFVGYVQDGETYTPRLYYQAGTHGIWRVAPWVQSGKFTYYGKGKDDCEESTNLPIALNLELKKLQNETGISMEGNDRKSFVKLFQLKAEAEKTIKSEYNDLGQDTPFQIENKEVLTCVDQAQTIIHPKCISTKKDAEPDFNLGKIEVIQNFEGTMQHDGTAYLVPSKDGKWNYLFFESKAECTFQRENGSTAGWVEKETHVSLLAVEYAGVEQKVSKFGSLTIIGDAQSVDAPMVEYASQYPELKDAAKEQIQFFGDPSEEEKTKFLKRNVPTSYLREQSPIIRQFKDWLSENSEKLKKEEQ